MHFVSVIEGDGEVDFDAKWLRQVLLNLLQNALNVSPAGGHVTLTATFTVDAWRVSLEDEGPGVPPEHRANIFKPYVTMRPKGVGLGLAIDLAKPDGTRQLLVPCIKAADTMDFATFWAAYEEVVRKARGGKVNYTWSHNNKFVRVVWDQR